MRYDGFIIYLFRLIPGLFYVYSDKFGDKPFINFDSHPVVVVTEAELQLLFIGMINSERVNNVTS